MEVDNTLTTWDVQDEDPQCHGDRNGFIQIHGVAQGVGPFEYSFNGGPFGNTTTFSNLGPGTYNLTVRDDNGCTMDTVVTITEPDPIGVDAEETYFVDYGDDLDLDSLIRSITGGMADEFDIFWVNEQGDTLTTTELKELRGPQLQYTVIIRHKDRGCIATDILNIFVKINRQIYIPNAFTPNGDQNNDVLRVYGKPGLVDHIKAFRVYDRWGELVYKNSDIIPFDSQGASAEGWDGYFKGEKMNPGVFVYYVEVVYFDNVEETAHGDATLISEP